MAKFKASRTSEISQMEKEHMELVRKMAAECMVLLENDGTLPLSGIKGNIALYGNGARRTVKGGTGSGDVNSRTVINIEKGLEEAGFCITTKSWLDAYDKLVSEAKAQHMKKLDQLSEETGVPAGMLLMFDHPFKEPQIQPVSIIDVEKSDTNTAIYVLARNSGEGRDRFNQEGDYLLSKEEIDAITILGKEYDKCIVLLNIGGVIDTKELKKIPGVNSVMLVGQAGNISGLAVADAICGSTIPSGKLVDTWALDYSDYPSSEGFSHNDENVDDEYYTEGIYVGYRYFDTFNVTPSYCFGYGISYTDFKLETLDVAATEEAVTVTVKVTNTGKLYRGKEVVQIYYSAPAKEIEKPYQELIAFGKTKLLEPGESQTLNISFKTTSMASYNEKRASWIMESGEYFIRVGNSSRNTKIEATIIVVQEAVISVINNLFQNEYPLSEISSKGVKPYSYPKEESEKAASKRIPIDTSKIKTEKIIYQGEKPVYQPLQSDQKLTMDDVIAGTAVLEDLVAQLTITELAELCVGTSRGGIGSQSVIGAASAAVPGAAGDTTSLMLDDRNIRNMIFADGPAGLRLNPHYIATKDGELLSGGEVFGEVEIGNSHAKEIPEDALHFYQYCTAIPIASLLSGSWDIELIEKAGSIVGKEMQQFGVTLWLAPGMNIHRNPLCGRNFEYYSEDPLLTGMCAAADTKGVQKFPGIGTTIKHYAVNNQEDNRFFSNSHVSERALREIYLKGFEIAAKTSQPMSVMSSYNLLNGIHTANHYELLTSVLRDEWGFAGFVMSDWFTSQNISFLVGEEEHKYPISSSPLCIKAGNDIQMPGCQQNVDDIVEAVDAKENSVPYPLTLGELQYCALNILKSVRQSSCYEGAKPYREQFGELPWIMKVE
ncbi:MAG TPA: glycoside hydrolase family 3 N-terminal domain-containing protein [Mobilitalea sp.]|nr:glycoside hydrolase family 3 N-terminal domain-containing protein [Mobilitalea sp.]